MGDLITKVNGKILISFPDAYHYAQTISKNQLIPIDREALGRCIGCNLSYATHNSYTFV